MIPAEKEPCVLFEELCLNIQQTLASDGTSKEIKDEYCNSVSKMNEEKHRWLQYKLLNDEVDDFLLACEAGDNTAMAVRDRLSLADLSSGVSSNSKTVLGLSHTDIQQATSQPLEVTSVQHGLIHSVEQKLMKNCKQLIPYSSASGEDSTTRSEALQQAIALKLPAVVEKEKQEAATMEEEILQQRIALEHLNKQYNQALLDIMKHLDELLEKHFLMSQKDAMRTSCEMMRHRCKAALLVLRNLEKQILCDTYDAGTVKALNVIKNELTSKIATTRQALSEVKQSLHTYQSKGPEFEELVSTYSSLLTAIENQMWAMSHLKPFVNDAPK